MKNHLAGANSPYLLQHAGNPVDWYPWGEEALAKARLENKPIFLSIGYAACHWCHVMERESYEDPDIAAFLNEHFVNIKVDREERPDLDSIYMSAVVAMTGQGGWPLNAFLTPEGKPFFGGTYFPPTPKYGMPSFRDVIASVAQAWQDRRDEIIESGEQIAQHLRGLNQTYQAKKGVNQEIIDQAALVLAQTYDWKGGGWGKAPKFPQPKAIDFLLQRAARGDRFALEISEHALRAMAKGGMYDLVGGGFARYSTDANWLVPHFEKMLYDNALLANAYLHAYLLTRDQQLKQVCTDTLDFVKRELTHPQGGFYSSLDADSEGEEGKYYLWTLDKIRAAIPNPADADFLIAAYGITESGNFEGRNILSRAMEDAVLAERFRLSGSEVVDRLKQLDGKLLTVRSDRIRPWTDDKVLVAWNGLMLIAFAEAARYLDRPDYLETARQNASFLLGNLRSGERLLRSWRDGRAQHNAYLEDYAALVLGLLTLYQSDPDVIWYRAAVELTGQMIAHFRDLEGGFFDTRDDHETLLTRPKDLQDNATPSGNAMAVRALLELAAFSGRSDFRELAEEALSLVQDMAANYPTAFGMWLSAFDFAARPVDEVAILGMKESSSTKELIGALWREWRPHLVASISNYPPESGAPELLHDRLLIDGQSTVYICHGFVCKQPVTSVEEMLELFAFQNS